MKPPPEWKGLALVRSFASADLVVLTGCGIRTAQNWRSGATIPGPVAWRAIVVAAGRGGEWKALSTWRECRKPGRPVSVERQRTIIKEARRKLGKEEV